MFRLTILLLACSVCITASLEGSAALAADNQANIAQELRVVWGGNVPRVYQGTITIEEGTFRIVRNLSMQESAISGLNQKESNIIEFSSNAPTTFGGLDISIRCSTTSKLRIRLRDNASDKPIERVVNVLDVQQKSWIDTVDDSASRLAIERQVYDRLRVESIVNTSGIFECNSIWNPTIYGYRTGLQAGEYHLTGSWTGRAGQPIFDVPIQIDSQGNFAAYKPEIKIPAIDGACRLELTIAKPNLMSALSGAKTLLTRSVDLVAFNPDAPVPAIASWRAVMALDTAAAIKPEGLNWVTSFTGSLANRALEMPESFGLPNLDLTQQINKLIPFSKSVTNFGAISKGGQLSVRDYHIVGASAAQRTTVLGPNSWIALPLAGLQVGKPHRLRIQIPIDHPSCLNVSIRDTSGDAGENLLDPQTCVEIKEEDCSPNATLTHDFVFWPKSDSASVLVASGNRTKSGLVGKILVESAEMTSHPANPVVSLVKRDVAIYLDQPLLVECFSAPREKDPGNGRWLESWKTWQAVAERIVMQMQLAGANTLVLSGVSGGNSIVPQKTTQQLHRLDKSTFFSDSRSPEMHDFVDLLLYHFDRAGLQLVLEVEPSANAQAWTQTNGKIDELAQVDLMQLDAKSSARDSASNFRPNPLSRKVEQANFEPLREIVQRYNRHQSFTGLSLRLNSNSTLLFIGDRWGYNEELLKQFTAENNVTFPSDPRQRAALLAGPARFRFINWRAKQLTNSYAKAAQSLAGENSNFKLYFNVMHLLSRAASETDFIDPERTSRSPHQLLLSYGIDQESLSKQRYLAITNGVVKQAKQTQSSSEWFRNAAIESTDTTSTTTSQSLLVTHQPKSMKLAADTEKPRSGELWIYPDASRTGKAAKRVLLEQIWKQDANMIAVGGWHPVWSMDSDVQRLFESMKDLPPVSMADLNVLPSDSPIKIRSVVFQDQAYLYLVNLSDWETSLQLLTAKSPTNVEVLASCQANLVEQTGTGLSIRVPACELIALKTTDVKSLEVRSANYQLPDSSLDLTVRRLEQFEALLAHAADPGRQEVLFGLGGSFEQWTEANKPAGWNVSTLPNTVIQRAAELPHSGNYSILIENRNSEPATAWIQSAPIELPETGRLTLRAWLRSSAADQAQPQVRLGLVGRLTNGGRYQRSIIYGSGQNDPTRALSIDWGRRPAELHVADIPVEDLIELQVAIDLIGPGRIWVDDVEVVQSWLHPDERNYLRGQMLVVKEKLNSKSPFAADRLLHSPWSDYLFELGTRLSNPQGPSVAVPGADDNRADWNKTKPTLQQFRESMRQRWTR
ncbi:MAG: hypothetical protein U0930_09505 [Pirellulales bacterium]